MSGDFFDDFDWHDDADVMGAIILAVMCWPIEITVIMLLVRLCLS